MNREERERMVDRLLDGALAAQKFEPREGLDERILANLRAQPTRRPWWRWTWLPALAAAILVAVGVHVARLHTPAPKSEVVQKQAPKVERKEAAAQRGTDKPQLASVPPSGSRPRRPKTRTVADLAPSPTQQIGKSASLPRQDVFPSPVPLTSEERALLALVRGNSPEATTVAQMQESEREKIQKYFETGEAPVAQPNPAPNMR